MRPRDFAYWLQGAFEICDPRSLSETQIAIIMKHIAMVEECQKGARRPLPHMGAVQSVKTILTDKKASRGAELAVLKKLLNAEFIHIDADTEGDQGAMNSIHGFDRPPGARC